jgi:hypothetical protein
VICNINQIINTIAWPLFSYINILQCSLNIIKINITYLELQQSLEQLLAHVTHSNVSINLESNFWVHINKNRYTYIPRYCISEITSIQGTHCVQFTIIQSSLFNIPNILTEAMSGVSTAQIRGLICLWIYPISLHKTANMFLLLRYPDTR